MIPDNLIPDNRSLSDNSFDESPAMLLIHHAVMPAAVIAMVASFLFYLVDVRSAFLGGGPHLKWIGFFFVMGTVLIERYSRASGDDYLQGCYTIALAGATIMVMLTAPWESGAPRFDQRLANLLIVAAVWRFATQVTRGLSPELDRPDGKRSTLLGVEQLTMQAWQSERARETGIAPPPPKKVATPIPRNPAVSVARLAAAALLAFALGEPVLLGAAPQTGVRALAAVIVFLFSTGIVLSAAATQHALRRAERGGGRASASLLPGRLALAAVFLAAVLAAGLALPGLDFQGTGRLRPPSTTGEGSDRDRGQQRTEQLNRVSKTPTGDKTSDFAGPAGSLLRFLATIGKWLIIPLALALFAAALLTLVRLWPLLASWRGRLADRWRRFLKRLADFFRWSSPRKAGGDDPLADLEGLSLLPPREAVLAAYQRFLAHLDRLGHPRPEKATPYELLNAFPPSLGSLKDPARTLTELYVQAAYAAEPVEPGAGQRAITALVGIRGLRERPAA